MLFQPSDRGVDVGPAGQPGSSRQRLVQDPSNANVALHDRILRNGRGRPEVDRRRVRPGCSAGAGIADEPDGIRASPLSPSAPETLYAVVGGRSRARSYPQHSTEPRPGLSSRTHFRPSTWAISRSTRTTPATVYAASSPDVLKSVDGGATWLRCRSAPGHDPRIVIDRAQSAARLRRRPRRRRFDRAGRRRRHLAARQRRHRRPATCATWRSIPPTRNDSTGLRTARARDVTGGLFVTDERRPGLVARWTSARPSTIWRPRSPFDPHDSSRSCTRRRAVRASCGRASSRAPTAARSWARIARRDSPGYYS